MQKIRKIFPDVFGSQVPQVRILSPESKPTCIRNETGGFILFTRPKCKRLSPAPENLYGFETDAIVNTGQGFGAVAHHPTVEAMLAQYRQLAPDSDGNFPVQACPALNTAPLIPMGLIPNGQLQQVAGALILPPDWLNPCDNATGKVTVLNFWGTWCTPCVNELPYFEQIAKDYGDRATVIAAHGMNSKTAPAYIASKYPDSPIIFLSDFIPEGVPADDPSAEFSRTGYYTMLGGVNNAYPRTTIIDENGVITHVFPNSVTHEQLEAAVEEALGK